MSKENTCCFSGHRQIMQTTEERLESKIKEVLAELYSRGFRRFLCGGAIGFDLMAAKCTLSLREVRQDVKLVMALPCINQADKWNSKQRRLYNEILQKADCVNYVSETFSSGCMHERNRFMVDNSSVCVCYCKSASGGTAYTVNYASKKGVTVLNLAD